MNPWLQDRGWILRFFAVPITTNGSSPFDAKRQTHIENAASLSASSRRSSVCREIASTTRMQLAHLSGSAGMGAPQSYSLT